MEFHDDPEFWYFVAIFLSGFFLGVIFGAGALPVVMPG